MFRKVPGPSESALKVPGPCESVLPNWSGLVQTCPNWSQLVGTPVALRDLPWVPIYLNLMPDRLHPSGIGAGPADLARSTAEGVGGLAAGLGT